jgi:hypothetical protein
MDLRQPQYKQTAVIGERSLQSNGMPSWASSAILLYETRGSHKAPHRTQATKGISEAWTNATVAISCLLELHSRACGLICQEL